MNGNEETINPDLVKDDGANENSLSSVITVKNGLFLFDKIRLFATYNDENGSISKGNWRCNYHG